VNTTIRRAAHESGEQEKAMTDDAMTTSDESLADSFTVQTLCERAAYRCLRPITWRLEQIASLPPLSDFIEVRPGTDGLLVHERDPAEWAYLLVLYKDHPNYSIRGWLWGHEAKQSRFRRRGDDGLPSFFVPLDSELFHPAETLIDELIRRPLVTGRCSPGGASMRRRSARRRCKRWSTQRENHSERAER
jgi:hypothetical protein